jgi:hypothetical protein
LGVADSIPNLDAFSTAELQALLTAAKLEILQRLTGRVQSGSSTGQSYSMNQYSTADLNRLVNALTSQLGLDTSMTFVRPNFNGPVSVIEP